MVFILVLEVKHNPAPPKLSTYVGENEWKPYIIQFNNISKKYNWSKYEKLDKRIKCLRDKPLILFSSRSDAV
jgi:hypothetical protein